MTNVIAFYRISEILNRDLESQKDDVELYCKQHNLNIIGEVIEEITGEKSMHKRPAIKNLMDEIDNLKPKYIIIPRLGGFANAGDMVYLLSNFHAKGIGLISVQETFWTIIDDEIQPSTTILLQSLNAAHDFEIDVILTMKNLKK